MVFPIIYLRVFLILNVQDNALTHKMHNAKHCRTLQWHVNSMKFMYFSFNYIFEIVYNVVWEFRHLAVAVSESELRTHLKQMLWMERLCSENGNETTISEKMTGKLSLLSQYIVKCKFIWCELRNNFPNIKIGHNLFTLSLHKYVVRYVHSHAFALLLGKNFQIYYKIIEKW